MARLSIRLLGSFQVALGSEPIETFKSDKVRALLAYLAVESERPHRRERLAGLLWPGFPERSARVNLRDALANLRQVIGDRKAAPPFLHTSRQALQFNSASDAWVDVWAFGRQVTPEITGQEAIGQLEEAVELYQGSFLEGFSLADSPDFEEWALLNRERLHRLATDALRQLATFYEQRGEYSAALGHARRLLELDPLLEAVHRQAMRLLVYGGERGAALAQYAACRRVLAEELDVTPSPETERLYEQIRSGELESAVPPSTPARELPIQHPAFLEEGGGARGERRVFVARERELERLERYLEQAVAGRGQVAFVIGGPGRGKTMLMEAFARRAMGAYPDLLVAGGNGNAYSGVGDPYLPFREALDMLSGDVEARWTAGAIGRDHALRLWHALPLTAQALVEHGPDLVDTFLPGRALVTRAAAYQDIRASDAVWRTRLEELVTRKASLPPDPNLQQSALFKQYRRVLAALAQQRPLLLLLDDLQWLDAGSVSLLFHLGRELSGCHILILGAYRPEEVALGRPATPKEGSVAGQQERHPLEGVLAEFKRRFSDVWLDLGRTDASEGRRFVEALLDSEPNRLDAAFRSALFRRTEGHPLFTAELLHAMQERGDLVQDVKGRWIAGPALNWVTLPPRVEGVIAERVNRLEGKLREILTVASVEGEEFTAQVIARVQDADERSVIRQLGGVLEKRHRLVSAQGVRRVNGLHLSRHRFQHNLFQKYLYSNLNQAERVYLHADVGNALEALYADHPEELAAVAPQLARHFREAGITEKAIEYLRQAGERATRMSANTEAVAHYTQALEMFATLADAPQRVEQELMLLVGLLIPLQTLEGYGTARLGRALDRAQGLCEKVGDTPQLVPVLMVLVSFQSLRGGYDAAHEAAERLLDLAERAKDPGLELVGHVALGLPLNFTGRFIQALAHYKHVIEAYDRHQHHALAHLIGVDVGVVSLLWTSLGLWFLGYPDQALKRIHETLDLAQDLAHLASLAFAQDAASLLYQLCRDAQRCQEWAKRCMALAREQGFPLWLADTVITHGWALAEQGQVEAGIAQMREGIAIRRSAGSEAGRLSDCLARLARAYGKAGKLDEGLAVLTEATAIVEKFGERYCEAEIHRIKGELLHLQGADEAQVERHYWKAIEVARGQSAKSYELRATMSLARLWQRQGRVEPARKMLAEVYGWFTEGFDTADLQDAKTLLDELC